MADAPHGFLAKLKDVTRRRGAPASPSANTQTSSHIVGVELVRVHSGDRETTLNALHDAYFDPEFDPLDHELSHAPLTVTAAQLEALAEERTTALEAVSEKLSHHIMRKYDAFAATVDEVILVEELIGDARLRAKVSREHLAVASVEVGRGIGVWRNTQRKKALSSILEPLQALRRAAELAHGAREALDRGEYCDALCMCAHCVDVARQLGPEVEISEGLLNAAGAALVDSVEHMRAVLCAMAMEFQPEQYHKVVEGYCLLAEVDPYGVASEVDLGQDARAAFAAAPAAAARKVVRGVLMARAGYEERAAGAQGLHELVALLPSDLFRTCLARVLMVVFDILSSHHELERWHRQMTSNGDNREAQHQLEEEQEDGAAVEKMDESSVDANSESGRENSRREATNSKTRDTQYTEILLSVSDGLADSRRLLWDEASRAVAVLLGSPAAVDGEHFLQVLSWTQRLAAVGEAFSGTEAASLKSVLNRQAGAFFRAFHASNLEALNSMLEKEMWRRLPVKLPPLCTDTTAAAVDNNNTPRSPNLNSLSPGISKSPPGAAAIAATIETAATTATMTTTSSSPRPLTTFNISTSSRLDNYDAFAQVVAEGNPWRRQLGSPRKQPAYDWEQQIAQPRLGFGGASVLADDYTAAAALDVDESGFHRTLSNQPRERKSENEGAGENEEVEGGETMALTGGVPQHDTASSTTNSTSASTNSSWRMARWMSDYALLMTTLPGISTAIFTGITELFDLYMLHVYVQFGGDNVAALTTGAPSASTATTEAFDGISPRLRAMLQHIAVGSIGKHRALLIEGTSGSKLEKALALASYNNGTANGSAHDHSMNSSSTVPSGSLTPGGKSGGKSSVPAGGHGSSSSLLSSSISGLTHSGNLYGLVERFAAADSLLASAQHLAEAAPVLAAAMPSAEATAPGAFTERAVGAAEDLRHVLLVRGCRLMLPTSWIPESVASRAYQAAEPPSQPAPWTQQLVRQLELFGAQVAGAAGLPSDGPARLWSYAAHAVANAIVDGLSRVKRCTLEGRAGMSLDLQAATHALGRLHPGVPETGALRLVDDYIKAFYVPLRDLPAWAAAHPQYTSAQVLALAGCVAESSGLKRRELTAAVARVEEGLRELGLI